MGEILSKKAGENVVTYRIKIPIKEAIQLKNNMKKVHVFSSENFNWKTEILNRGNNGGAKYFHIPLGLKSRKKKRYSEISYQRMDLDKKTFYLLVASKNNSD